uniref:Uncharacterized protein n=1 Tax=Arundo donax TaxID=35708 RepID=A0A0A9C745_ARUDO
MRTISLLSYYSTYGSTCPWVVAI